MGVDDIETRLAALELRVRDLEDEREIRELLSRYGHYADAGLHEDFYSLFTGDVVMDVSSGHADDPYALLRWEGLQKMKEFMAVRSAEHGDDFVGRSLHVQGNNLTVSVTEDDARAVSYSYILQQVDPDVRLVSASINEWHLRRVRGRWRIGVLRRRRVGAPDTAATLQATSA